MKTFSTFYFTWYNFDKKTFKASFSYSFDHEVDFTEIIDFASNELQVLPTIDTEIMDTLLFHLSLAVWISYYKLFPTKDLVVETGKLNNDQQVFWKTFYLQGLGEFFFRNNISPTGLLNFVNGAITSPNKQFSCNSQTPIVALGGGKDSLVSVELIKKLHIPFFTATFGKDYYLHAAVNAVVGVPRLVMTRTFDPQLFAMNQQWWYNGHVPISGIIAFVLTTAAYLYNFQYIVMSNEKSANEGNTFLEWIDINHQRSKSYQFESEFSQYLKKYISPDIAYFSIVRGMYELKIAQIFAQYPQYFSTFSSCNNNFKVIEANKTTDHRRCGVCPKCAFVYSILRPFISDEQTQTIFGQELYENADLLVTYKELLGIEWIKPFECVGTNEEVTYAMYLYYQKIKHFSQIPPIMKLFKNKVLPNLSPIDLHNFETKLMQISHEETNIPEFFLSCIPHS